MSDSKHTCINSGDDRVCVCGMAMADHCTIYGCGNPTEACINHGDCEGMMAARDEAISLQAQTIADLQAEIARLRELMTGEGKVRKIHYTPEGGAEIEIEHWGVKMIAASVLDTFEQSGGVNFVTCTLHDGDKGPIEVTVRPLWGTKAVAQVLDELRQELAQVKAERDSLQRQLDEVRA